MAAPVMEISSVNRPSAFEQPKSTVLRYLALC